MATIHSHGRQWTGAHIIDRGADSLEGKREVLIVRHKDFTGNMQFYAQPDKQGRHLNVGNGAFWLTKEQGES